MTKKEARKVYRELRKNISMADREEASKNISKRIVELIEKEDYKRVLMYAALPEEVNLDAVFDCLNGEVEFYFPRVNEEEMEFYRATSLKELETGNFGVREPKTECAKIQYDEDKYLMLVPGMAFDKNGYRLGYGKGYYDKYLATNEQQKINTIGICFNKCMVEELPHDEYDIKVEKVFCE